MVTLLSKDPAAYRQARIDRVFFTFDMIQNLLGTCVAPPSSWISKIFFLALVIEAYRQDLIDTDTREQNEGLNEMKVARYEV